jgi:hypothetical protein
MVAQHRDLPVALRGQPIELNDPALFFAPAYSNKSDISIVPRHVKQPPPSAAVAG